MIWLTEADKDIAHAMKVTIVPDTLWNKEDKQRCLKVSDTKQNTFFGFAHMSHSIILLIYKNKTHVMIDIVCKNFVHRVWLLPFIDLTPKF